MIDGRMRKEEDDDDADDDADDNAVVLAAMVADDDDMIDMEWTGDTRDDGNSIMLTAATSTICQQEIHIVMVNGGW
jgi:hypothetical protein